MPHSLFHPGLVVSTVQSIVGKLRLNSLQYVEWDVFTACTCNQHSINVILIYGDDLMDS